MAMSGVKLTESCMSTYNDIQKSKKHRYAIFMIKDGQIDVEKVGDRNNSFEDYLSDLHQKDGEAEDCRYGLYDYEYKYNPDGAESTFKSKIFLMSWCPDSSRIKKKMLYSSSFDTLKRAFVGVHKVIQANDKSECAQDAVEEILRSTDRN
ncbi:cofilin/actin-depolymerizing factor homolog [Eurytemora carolleeae]|uniref:cofilin/actin-depolymerizing factor homolog n=1 Tax=Eurytemora carolleeae TaxID=1294199 RepID=UPI000C766AA8|nr:cofilin/actin-depolymerizing factor homolog [Eurytemora carolleeae]|eukprot:XP_023327961.1 cofilin/actin-depolymerizing factor homolog [Eurytemora affinis]